MFNSCPDCGAITGTLHFTLCDTARCLETGHQRLTCAEGHDCGKDRWEGRPSGSPECIKFGLYARFTERRWVPCEAGDPGAMPDYNRLADSPAEFTWSRENKRWVRVDNSLSLT